MMKMDPSDIHEGVFAKQRPSNNEGLNTKIFGANTELKDVIHPKNGV